MKSSKKFIFQIFYEFCFKVRIIIYKKKKLKRNEMWILRNNNEIFKKKKNYFEKSQTFRGKENIKTEIKSPMINYISYFLSSGTWIVRSARDLYMFVLCFVSVTAPVPVQGTCLSLCRGGGIYFTFHTRQI